ncbi:MAG: BsaA family SipW-dependent biofilm matrix protein [Bacilli bacterium]|nr:BsaA family SipW-dependent biofilm matrix protein [Bacilli bacterium]
MNMVKSKRSLLFIIIGILVMGVGSTLAYLTSTGVFNNIFNTGTFETRFHEEFTSPTNWMPGDETPKTITVKNEGETEAYVRICLSDEWEASDGTILTNHSDELNIDIALINRDNENDWTYVDSERCFYYKELLGSGEETSSPIKSVTFNPVYSGSIECTTDQLTGNTTCKSTNSGYDGATYTLTLTAQAIQKEGLSAWGMGYSTNGSSFDLPTSTQAITTSGYNTFLRRSLSSSGIDNSVGFVLNNQELNNQEYYLSELNSYDENKAILTSAFGSENCQEITGGGSSGPKAISSSFSGYYCECDDLEVELSDYGSISVTHYKENSSLTCKLVSSPGGGDRSLFNSVSAAGSNVSDYQNMCFETKNGYYLSDSGEHYSTSSLLVQDSGYRNFIKKTLNNTEWTEQLGYVIDGNEYYLNTIFDENNYETNKAILNSSFATGECHETNNGDFSDYICEDDYLKISVSNDISYPISISSFISDKENSCYAKTGESSCNEITEMYFFDNYNSYSSLEYLLEYNSYSNFRRTRLSNKTWINELGFIENDNVYYLIGISSEYENNKAILNNIIGSSNCIEESDVYTCNNSNYEIIVKNNEVSIENFKSNKSLRCTSNPASCIEYKEIYKLTQSSTSCQSVSEMDTYNTNNYKTFLRRGIVNSHWRNMVGLKTALSTYYLIGGDQGSAYLTNKLVLNNIFGADNCNESIVGDRNEYYCENNPLTLRGYANNSGIVYFSEVDGVYNHKNMSSAGTFETRDYNASLSVQGTNSSLIFNKSISRTNFETITVVNHINIPNNAIASWNVSDGGNEDIFAWYTDVDSNRFYELYIGQVGGVVANPNSDALFSLFPYVRSIDVSNLITTHVTDMGRLFYSTGWNATSFEITGLENWDTSNVVNMRAMFAYRYSDYQQPDYCQNNSYYISNINNWDTSNVENMADMFSFAGYDATTWSIGDLSNWNTSKVTKMSGMFNSNGGRSSVFNIGNLNNWDTSSVTDMARMFYGAGYYATAWSIGDLSRWNTSNVTSMSMMFNNAGYNATTWGIGDLSSWDTKKVTNMYLMFYGAGSESSTFTSIGTFKIYADNIERMFNAVSDAKATLNIYSNPTSYDNAFTHAATNTGSLITVNYSRNTTNIDNIIATKSTSSNVVKGSLLD